MTSDFMLGVVVIGRNEGQRLRRCLSSTANLSEQVVYVDSGSSDDSIKQARKTGANVVSLDQALRFTAARARNAGFLRLLELAPNLEFVQFVDGDCEIVPGWGQQAREFLQRNPRVAMVCGAVIERFPGASVYNKLCSMEWESAVGETKACGGIAMVRVAAFQEVNGFRADLIAGEEPELCVRLRAAGWVIWRLDAEMALHDAAMTRFAQWWRRAVRGGYAYAEGAHIHGEPPERHWVRESRRAWVWGVALPAATAALALLDPRWLLVLLAYPAQVVRLALSGTRSLRDNWIRAFFLVLGRFPEAVGQIQFLIDRLRSRRRAVIEYK